MCAAYPSFLVLQYLRIVCLRGPLIRTAVAVSDGYLVCRLWAGRGELAHQSGVVADGPVVGAFPVGKADHVHLLIGEAAPGRGESEELAGVPPLWVQ